MSAPAVSPSKAKRSDIDGLPVVSPQLLLKKRIEDRSLVTLTKLSVGSLHNMFSAIESEQLDKEKFSQAMSNHGIKFFEDHAVAEGFYNALDVDHNGNIDKKELICGLAVLADGDLEHKLKLTFNIFDLNRDHFIQPEELKALLRSVAKVNYASDTELETFVDQFVANTFERYDANKDNKLSFEEFSEAAASNSDIARFFTLQGVATI